MKPLAVLACVAALVVGCAHVAGAGQPRPDPASIRILNAPPAEPYDVLGIATCEEDELKECFETLQEQALKLNGQAVVVTFQTSTSGHAWTSGKVQLAGDVIRYKQTPQPAAGTPQ